MSETQITLTIAAIGVTGFACQWAAWRLKLPAILLLLVAGILAGPVTGLLTPSHLFGELLFPLVSLCVAIILFEGSLTLEFSELKGVGSVVKNLISLGALFSWGSIAAACHFLLGFDWGLSLLFGSLTIVTGPTVITPLLRTVRPNNKIANILRWEGILIDPIGALLAVLVYEFMTLSGDNAISHTLITLFEMILIGLTSGIAAGWGLSRMLKKQWLPEYLHNIATLNIMLMIFVLSNMLASESGLLSVTVFGIWLANAKDIKVDQILHFKENLTLFLISGLFIVLAARIEWQDLLVLGLPMLALLMVIQLLVRPLAVLISSIGSSLNWREKALLAWVAPRGIVAAAVSALFALKLVERDHPHAQLLVAATFAVIIATVILQSLTAAQLAKWLKVADPSPSGFLIIGANNLAIDIGSTLNKAGFRVLLADANWDHISAARLAGLEIYYGNPLSSHAEEYLDLIGIGHLLAITPNRHLNVMAGMRFMHELGHHKVFCINSNTNDTAKLRAADDYRGKTLFSGQVSYRQLASLHAQGATLKTTKLSDAYSYQQYLSQQGNTTIPMFAIDGEKHIHVFAEGGDIKPDSGWSVISLVSSKSAATDTNRLDNGKTT
ncbi:K(+)/H(+) antiporter NhaP2 [Sinobacterium norvegicum]|uniref:K(+)/H(+) antiporter NhaP2 n=1 Tax=Sinobacterium norvegicum TaxID=1641715 RepID=A0ABN8EDM2_9GAMM|nr:sodium:proton antiporter [Sinobacterium norvegicum]CAH0990545.1 K(+)/H(+) antiporter NhaP2 [Sinobacterium norvegicum]